MIAAEPCRLFAEVPVHQSPTTTKPTALSAALISSRACHPADRRAAQSAPYRADDGEARLDERGPFTADHAAAVRAGVRSGARSGAVGGAVSFAEALSPVTAMTAAGSPENVG